MSTPITAVPQKCISKYAARHSVLQALETVWKLLVVSVVSY